MGNKASNNTINKSNKWNESTTKIEKIYQTFGKPYAIACELMNENKNEILICTADQSGALILNKMSFSHNKKGKISFKCSLIKIIPLRSAWVMTCAISPTCKYVASGGLDNLITVHQTFDVDNSSLSHQPYRECQQHEGYISCIKFISDNILASASGDATVIIWDVEQATPLSHITGATGDIESMDYIYLNYKHIIAFGSIDSNVYIRDITNVINDNNNIDHDEKYDKFNDEKDETLICAMSLGSFRSDVNSVSFSPNGEYLAATSDDCTYEIYAKNYKYDSFWDAKTLEWTFICKREFNIYANHSSGTCVKWINNETLVVGCDETSDLFCTFIQKQNKDPETVKVINDSVLYIIKSLPSMKWIGLCDTIANEIIQYLCDYTIIDFEYHFTNRRNATRVSSITSCMWNETLNQSIVLFGCWDKQIRAILQK